MQIPFSPQLLEMAMARLGIAAAQLKTIDTDAKKAMFRFIISAVNSGDANGYIKEAFALIDERDARRAEPPRPEPPPPPAYKATSRPITDRKR